MKAIRDNKTSITNIRIGKYDYLARIQPKDSRVRWNEIPPVKLSDIIPPFNVGIIDKIMEKEDTENDEDDEEIRLEMEKHMQQMQQQQEMGINTKDTRKYHIIIQTQQN